MSLGVSGRPTRRTFLAASAAALGTTAGVAPTAADCDGIDYETVVLVEGDAIGVDLESGRCIAHPEFLAGLGAEEDHQLRLGVLDAGDDATYDEVLVTVDDEHDDAEPIVYASETDLERLGVDRFAAGQASATIPHPCLETRAEADEHDELVEVLREGDRDDASVVVLAPHGGYVEIGTGRQAQRANEAYGVPAWICYAFDSDGGALNRWHVTSTAIHDASFPELGRISDREYATALSLHGRSDFGGYDEEFVGVGGGDEEARAAVASALEDAYESCGVDVPVRELEAGEPYAGTADDNVVNRIPASDAGGVQLEQPKVVREDHGDLTVCAAVEALLQHEADDERSATHDCATCE